MNRFHMYKALSLCLTSCVVVALVIAACAIRLSGDDQAEPPTSLAPSAEPMASRLQQCRTVKFDQQDALAECERLWAKQRQRFLGERSGPSPSPESATSGWGALPPLPRKDESYLPAGYPAIPAQSE
jgi:conjugative transfer region protein TrbK